MGINRSDVCCEKQKFYATYIPRDNEGELYISLATSRLKTMLMIA